MKNKRKKIDIFFIIFLFTTLLIITYSCDMKKDEVLEFKDYPNLKLGFSTQNFQSSMPLNVESIKELINYAASEGYSFIQLRDPKADLSLDECEELSEFAGLNNIEVIYEINTNFLAPDFMQVFLKGLENTAAFPTPGILRTIVSTSEFISDVEKKGWTKEELNEIVELAERCGRLAKDRNIIFLVENANEAFFGEEPLYYGFADFFKRTQNIGLQFDTANPFQDLSREKSDPDEVEEFLKTNAGRWIVTHLKSSKDGASQPMLTDNPLEFDKIFSIMSDNNIPYVSIELVAVPDKQGCFDNHSKSIDYLIKNGFIQEK